MPACSAPADPDCEAILCDNGTCKSNPSAVGTACANATKVCDGKGACVACNLDGDCKDAAKPSCVSKECVPAGCKDGSKDGDETDVDCGGGVCGKCADGRECSGASDCASGTCAGAPLKCGVVVVPPSCAGGLDCGGVSCCDAQAVPGGTFPMGRGNGTDAYAGGAAQELPEHNVTVADFRLDSFEITVGRFRKFVEQFDGTPPAAGAGAHPLIANSGWQAAWNGSLAASQAALISSLKSDALKRTWTDAPGANESYAINCVSWFDVAAFCAWDGGRLPTEAEWEYAAAGGSENRLYPWGPADPSVTKTLANDVYSDNSPFVAIGSHPTGNGKWGHRDLAGGMWEWNLDWYDDVSWYKNGACGDCANLLANPYSFRVERGGSWFYAPTALRSAYRYGDPPTSRGANVGARCARLPASCINNLKDGTETDVDCGGAFCNRCADTKACLAASDCASGSCTGNKCGPPSCAGGLDCGGVSCCDAPLVPGGTFPMGRGNGTDAYAGGNANEQPEHNVTVADFRLDTFEITVGRFRKFVEQFDGTPPAPGAGAHPLIANSGWQAAWNGQVAASQAALVSNLKCDGTYQTWTDAPGANESYAINCLSWYEATAFCGWDGGRMPTEAEWEYASAGGSDNRLYPWGATDPSVTKTLANDVYSDNSPFISVGSHASGNGKWGHRDLAGGMWEWNLDYHDSVWYSGGGNGCSNCANLNISSLRVVRGRGWYADAPGLRAAYRGYGAPTDRSYAFGVRCARSAP